MTKSKVCHTNPEFEHWNTYIDVYQILAARGSQNYLKFQLKSPPTR